MESVPLIYGTAPGECDQARYDGANEDEIADHVNASKLLLPPSLSLVVDVQENEETCKGNCRSQLLYHH